MQTFIDALPLAPEESQRLTSPKAPRLEPNLRHLAVCRIKPKTVQISRR